MGKKASILTFHCVPNYGAVLQAYGLQEVLKKLFTDVEIIDYRPDNLTKEYRCINTYSLASIISSLVSLKLFKRKKKKFSTFENEYMNKTEIKSKRRISFNNYETDILFLGSDQIWNPEITKGFDSAFFGYIGTQKIKAVSYAASIGKGNYSKKEKEELNSLLKRVSTISVREEEARIIMKQNFNLDAKVVVDPTVLAGRECFELLADDFDYNDYLLFYSLNGSIEAIQMAEKVARYFDYEEIELSGRRKSLIPKKHKVIYDAGPKDFISLIKNCKYVVTDSFHGTVFAILFHKPFISIPHKTRGGRLKTLLSFVGLNGRLTSKFNTKIVCEAIEWDDVDKRIEKRRTESLEFIENVISEIENENI